MDSRRVVLSCSQSAARLTTGTLRQAGLALHLLLARFHLGKEEVEEEEEEEEVEVVEEVWPYSSSTCCWPPPRVILGPGSGPRESLMGKAESKN